MRGCTDPSRRVLTSHHRFCLRALRSTRRACRQGARVFVVNPQTLGALVAESGATRGRLQTLVITDVLKSAAGRARMTRHDLHDLCHGLHVSPQPNDAELVISIARDRQKCRRSTGCMCSRPLYCSNTIVITPHGCRNTRPPHG